MVPNCEDVRPFGKASFWFRSPKSRPCGVGETAAWWEPRTYDDSPRGTPSSDVTELVKAAANRGSSAAAELVTRCLAGSAR